MERNLTNSWSVGAQERILEKEMGGKDLHLQMVSIPLPSPIL